MGELILKYWAPIWALLTTAAIIVMAFLAKTYAKKEDVQAVSKKVDHLESKLDSMPTQQQMTELLIELANTRGEMKELRARIQPVQHLSRLLLEQRLKDDK
jgi:predicted  nucleic acid-binding Zn-ribbon protein